VKEESNTMSVYTYEEASNFTTFRYDVSSLVWDSKHRHNSDEKYCYCGQAAKASRMLFCDECHNWFHDSCLQCVPHAWVPGNWGYRLLCGCCGNGTERFAYVAKSWESIVGVAMFNLHAAGHSWLHVTDDICKFIAMHFDSLAFGKKRTATWQSVVNATLAAKPSLFTYKGSGGFWKLVDPSDPCLFMDGLNGGKHRIAAAAATAAAATAAAAAVATTDTAVASASSSSTAAAGAKKRAASGAAPSAKQPNQQLSVEEAVQRRETQLKRRRERERERRAKREEASFVGADGELVHGSALAAAKAFRTAEEEAAALVESASIRIKPSRAPELMYWEPEFYAPDAKTLLARFVKENSAPQVHMSKDGLTLHNDKGYRLARASHPAVAGRYYFEVQFLADSPADSHIRVGFATQKADPQAPVGYDGFGYGIRDIDTAIVHRARRRPFAGRQVQRGDVIGCLIDLPAPLLKECDGDVATITEAEIADDSAAPLAASTADAAAAGTAADADFSFDNVAAAATATAAAAASSSSSSSSQAANSNAPKTYYDHSRGAPPKPPSLIKPPNPTPGPVCIDSAICFYLNGVPLRDASGEPKSYSMTGRPAHHQYAAFTDIHSGLYYPAVSCFNGARVRVTLGPESFDAEGEEGAVNTHQFRYAPNDVEELRSFSELAQVFAKQHARAMALTKLRQERRNRIESERLERAAAAAAAEMQQKAALAWLVDPAAVAAPHNDDEAVAMQEDEEPESEPPHAADEREEQTQLETKEDVEAKVVAEEPEKSLSREAREE
jgi:hypothetical protein